jgi:integrase
MNFESELITTINLLAIRETTRKNYLWVARKYLIPQLGSALPSQLTANEVRQVLACLSPQTGALALAVLKSFYREHANSLQGINPTIGIRAKRLNVKSRPFLTLNELKECDFGRYQTQILFLASHGLRWGEAVVLEESDFKNGRVTINKSIHGQTKSKASIRSVPQISEFRPLPKAAQTLRKVCHANGIHIHSLRSSYAYLLKESGVHVTTAQRLLGHSDPKVTLGIYTKFRDSEIDSAGELIRAFIH